MHPGHTQKPIVERELESTGSPPAGPPLTHGYTEQHTLADTDTHTPPQTDTQTLRRAAARCVDGQDAL